MLTRISGTALILIGSFSIIGIIGFIFPIVMACNYFVSCKSRRFDMACSMMHVLGILFFLLLFGLCSVAAESLGHVLNGQREVSVARFVMNGIYIFLMVSLGLCNIIKVYRHSKANIPTINS